MTAYCNECRNDADRPHRVYDVDGSVLEGCTATAHDRYADAYHMEESAIIRRWQAMRAEAEAQMEEHLGLYDRLWISRADVKMGNWMYDQVRSYYLVARRLEADERVGELHRVTRAVGRCLRELIEHNAECKAKHQEEMRR